MISYFRQLNFSRELLYNLTLREIRGKYKRTVLGQLWSLANPIASMIIYTFVFSFIFRASTPVGSPSGLDSFPLWLITGLLPWLFFVNVINQSAGSLLHNAGLIQKVYFPRVVLPLSTLLSAGYNWIFETLVLIFVLAIAGSFIWPWLFLLMFCMLLLGLFASGLGMILAVVNVHFRDTEHLLSLFTQIWMYLTPIIYPLSLVQEQSDRIGTLGGTNITIMNIYELNPMVHFVTLFREVLYDNKVPDLSNLIYCLSASLISILLGFFIFHRNEKGLAEAL